MIEELKKGGWIARTDSGDCTYDNPNPEGPIPSEADNATS
jgi:hypothetical protein